MTIKEIIITAITVGLIASILQWSLFITLTVNSIVFVMIYYSITIRRKDR